MFWGMGVIFGRKCFWEILPADLTACQLPRSRQLQNRFVCKATNSQVCNNLNPIRGYISVEIGGLGIFSTTPEGLHAVMNNESPTGICSMHRTSRGYRYVSPDGDKTIPAGASTIYRYASSNEDFFRQEYQQILSNVSGTVPIEGQPVRAEWIGRNMGFSAFFSQALGLRAFYSMNHSG